MANIIRDLDSMIHFHDAILEYIENLKLQRQKLNEATTIIKTDFKEDTQAKNHVKILCDLSEISDNMIATLTEIADDYAYQIGAITKRM